MVLSDLKFRLDSARPFTKPLEGIQQQYGMNTNLLKEIVEYWRTEYDWKERENFLNQYPQFRTNIQGLDVHFLHVKPNDAKGLKVLPMLLLHGWPGTVREFYETIPLLTTPRKGQDFVFEVIVPSLPGYGFSDPAVRAGFSPSSMAVLFKNLMLRLGHEKFYIQGGDWGAAIVSIMAKVFPENVQGVHSNACFLDSPMITIKLLLGSICPSFVVDKKYEDRLYPMSSKFSFTLLESGYMHIQATKPDTVGVALNDSPVGLAAYILEKFTTWTNPEWKNRADGGLKDKFTYDQLLDNVMIYWISNSITTSARLYSEFFNWNYRSLNLFSIPVTVPSACSWYKHELAYFPESMLRTGYHNLVHLEHFEDGGHFAAFELPKVFADDVWTAVAKMEKVASK